MQAQLELYTSMMMMLTTPRKPDIADNGFRVKWTWEKATETF